MHSFRHTCGRSFTLTSAVILILSSLYGCGQKGPLYFPQDTTATAQSQPEQTQQTESADDLPADNSDVTEPEDSLPPAEPLPYVEPPAETSF